MKEYAFDVQLYATIRVKAENEDRARALLRDRMAVADCNAGAWPNGDPILFEASATDDAHELIEIDGVYV